jgi:hypothetical protein
VGCLVDTDEGNCAHGAVKQRLDIHIWVKFHKSHKASASCQSLACARSPSPIEVALGRQNHNCKTTTHRAPHCRAGHPAGGPLSGDRLHFEKNISEKNPLQ